MSVSSISSMQRRSRVGREALSRVALTTLGALGLILSPARTSDAQTSAPQRSAWELRVTGGAFVPTGSQRNTLGDAHLTAAQLSWLVRPSLAVTGTFGWARSRDVASAEAPKLDVFTSDVGVEARAAQWFGDRKVTFSPFVGAGVGARSYNYRKLDVDATTNLAAYGAVGGELGVGRVGLRLEVRDYATGFRPLLGGGRSVARNDLVLMAGLRFNRHRTSQN
jgi:outer membrane protein W